MGTEHTSMHLDCPACDALRYITPAQRIIGLIKATVRGMLSGPNSNG